MRTKLNQEELNERAHEVFILEDTDVVYDLEVVDDRVIIEMSEMDEDFDETIFNYEPDMTGRPEALDYLLGLRNDFND